MSRSRWLVALVVLVTCLPPYPAIPVPPACTNWLGSAVPCTHPGNPFLQSAIRDIREMDLLPAVNMSITTVVVKKTTEVQDDDDISFEGRLDDTKDLSNLSNIVTFSIEL